MPEQQLLHDWYLDEDGEVDQFRLDIDVEGVGHNGPWCRRCDDFVCVHCNPEWRKLECPGGTDA